VKTSFKIPLLINATLTVTLLAACLPASAQHSAFFRGCNQKAKSQAEMNACANQEAARAETERVRLYNTLLEKASSPPDAAVKIKAAEKAWIAYRNAYLEAMYPAADKQAEYGTIYPMEADLLRARLTTQHVSELRNMLQQYNDGR
jgi:uncharacterized protein YecT (DUF1311 family)